MTANHHMQNHHTFPKINSPIAADIVDKPRSHTIASRSPTKRPPSPDSPMLPLRHASSSTPSSGAPKFTNTFPSLTISIPTSPNGRRRTKTDPPTISLEFFNDPQASRSTSSSAASPSPSSPPSPTPMKPPSPSTSSPKAPVGGQKSPKSSSSPTSLAPSSHGSPTTRTRSAASLFIAALGSPRGDKGKSNSPKASSPNTNSPTKRRRSGATSIPVGTFATSDHVTQSLESLSLDPPNDTPRPAPVPAIPKVTIPPLKILPKVPPLQIPADSTPTTSPSEPSSAKPNLKLDLSRLSLTKSTESETPSSPKKIMRKILTLGLAKHKTHPMLPAYIPPEKPKPPTTTTAPSSPTTTPSATSLTTTTQKSTPSPSTTGPDSAGRQKMTKSNSFRNLTLTIPKETSPLAYSGPAALQSQPSPSKTPKRPFDSPTETPPTPFSPLISPPNQPFSPSTTAPRRPFSMSPPRASSPINTTRPMTLRRLHSAGTMDRTMSGTDKKESSSQSNSPRLPSPRPMHETDTQFPVLSPRLEPSTSSPRNRPRSHSLSARRTSLDRMVHPLTTPISFVHTPNQATPPSNSPPTTPPSNSPPTTPPSNSPPTTPTKP